MDGFLKILPQGQELLLQFQPHHRIQRAEGLVEQQHGRIGRQGPRDADSLALPAGELPRIARPELARRHPDFLEQ